MNRGDRFRRSPSYNDAAVRGRARVLVGAVYSRTDGLESLALSYDQTFADLSSQMGYAPGHPFAKGEGHTDVLLRDAQGKIRFDAQGHRMYGPPIPEGGGNPVALQWWNATAKPTFDAWNVFRQDLLGDDLTVANDYIHWTNRMKLTRETLEGWRNRLLGVREGAKLVGLALHTPDPEPLPKTFVDNIEDFGGNVLHKVDEAWTLGKIALYGGLALGAVLVVSSIVTNVRAGSDPAKPYLQLAGRGR